jgi:lipid biosynthesis B12-binding/radical SAM protein
VSRIFLISSNTIADPYPVYPLGMAVLAAHLSSQGHTIHQFDYFAAAQSSEQLHSNLSRFRPDVVGISLRNIDNVDSTSPDNCWSLALNRDLVTMIREMTDAPVVAGGPAFSIMPEAIVEYIDADYGIVGEGEPLFNGLIRQIKEGKKPNRVIRNRNDSHVDVNGPQPLWDRELIHFYRDRGGVMGLQTKRGCAHHCTYCTYPAVEGSKLRCMQPGRVADEIERLVKDFGIRSISFVDSVFNDPQSNYLSIAEELIHRELDIVWSAFFRPDRITRDELRLLTRSGLYMIELGTDAATDATLAELNKGFCFEKVIEFNHVSLQEQVPCLHYVMFGCPGESDLTVKEGLRNIESLKTSIVMAFSGIRIFPGTVLHERSIEDGLVPEDGSLLSPLYYFSPNVDKESMNDTIGKAFANRRDRIFPPSEGYIRLRALKLFGFLGALRSDVSVKKSFFSG